MLCQYMELGESRRVSVISEILLLRDVCETVVECCNLRQKSRQETTMNYWKTTQRRKMWNVNSSKRERGQQGDCQGSKLESPADS